MAVVQQEAVPGTGRVEQIRRELPPDIELIPGFDVTTTIRAAISEVRDTIFLAMGLVSYGPSMTILGLWGGPYLTHIYGYDLTGRATTSRGSRTA